MIFVSSVTFDPDAALEIDDLASSDYGAMTRRSNKVATLDLGVAVNDFGYTDADREFQVNLKLTQEIDETLRYIVRTYGLVNVSTREGFYTAIPSYSARAGIATLKLSITAQLA